jgi:SAM-dependent methyltransferase
MNTTLSYYQNNASELSKRYESAEVSNLHKILLETFTTNSKLLDIGCGSGRDTKFMVNNGYNLIAIDGSENMIKEAKRIHPTIKPYFFVRELPFQLDFKMNQFDGIYSIATLMHLTKDEIIITIKQIYAILKTNGKFLFSISIERDDIDRDSKDIHQRQFTSLSEKEWLTICEMYGFITLDTKVTNDGLNRDGIIWLTCILQKT